MEIRPCDIRIAFDNARESDEAGKSASISLCVRRLNLISWHRDKIVAGNECKESAIIISILFGGGSSNSLRSAFDATRDNPDASSRIPIFTRKTGVICMKCEN